MVAVELSAPVKLLTAGVDDFLCCGGKLSVNGDLAQTLDGIVGKQLIEFPLCAGGVVCSAGSHQADLLLTLLTKLIEFHQAGVLRCVYIFCPHLSCIRRKLHINIFVGN